MPDPWKLRRVYETLFIYAALGTKLWENTSALFSKRLYPILEYLYGTTPIIEDLPCTPFCIHELILIRYDLLAHIVGLIPTTAP